MKKYSCPHCREPGITALRKAFLGPAWSATCKACGKKVGVPFVASALAISPLMVLMMIRIFELVASSVLWVASIVVAGVVSTAIHLRWVDLERR